MAKRTIKVFISSPGDVGQERLICARILERLQGEFAGFLDIEPMLWEHEPLRASAHFQDEIDKPSDADVVVCILWSRLGTRLPEHFRREDGSTYDSGTEWEYEDALNAFRKTGKPDILVYKKTMPPFSDMSDEDALIDRLNQKKKLDGFLEKWFGSHKSGFKTAFHPFETPDKFEQMAEEHLRRLIREKVPERLSDDESAPAVTWTRGSPFRGLSAFQYEHAAVFFGRTKAIGDVKEALARRAAAGCAFVMVLGASGGGKSSLVRAGVVPTVCQPGVIDGIGLWRRTTVRPSDGDGDIYQALARALLAETALPELKGAGYDLEELAKLIARAPDAVVGPVRIALRTAAERVEEVERLTAMPEARLLLTLDQTEELFTGEQITAEQASHFVDLIDALARSGLVFVVATMRDDFYHRTAQIKRLVTLMEGEGQYHLLPPDFSEIGQMIRQPARAAGLRFEIDRQSEERLDEVLQTAAAKDSGALPLMSFMLDELYDRRTEDGYLTFEAYRELGGLEGALAKRAEDVFTGLDPLLQEALHPLLRRLVTLAKGEDDRATARRPTVEEAVGGDADREALMNAFVEARLLVVDGEGGVPHVRIAHEALLTRWPRLAVWLEADKAFLRLRGRIADQAAHWRDEDESPELLLPEGKPLFDARDLLRARREDLDGDTIAFIEASYAAFQTRQDAEVEAQRRKLRRTRLLAVSMAVLALVAAAGGWLGYTGQREAEALQTVAEQRAREAEEARREAVRLAEETAFQARRTEAARQAAEVALERAEKQTRRALGKQSEFLARVSRERVAAGDIRTALELALAALPSNFERPERPYVPEAEAALYEVLLNHRAGVAMAGHAGTVGPIRFSPDRTRMVSVGSDGRALVWNAAGVRAPALTLDGHGVRLTDAAVSPDGRIVATAAADGRIGLWRAADGGQRVMLAAHDGPVAALAMGPDGRRLASAGWDGRIAVTDPRTGTVETRIDTGLGRLSGLVALPAGGWLVSGWNGRLAHVADGAVRIHAPGAGGITTLATTPDGGLAAFGTLDGESVLIEPASGTVRARLRGFGAAVTAIALAGDGERAITADAAGRAILWHVADGRQLAILSEGGASEPIVASAFGPDGALALTADESGVVRLWRTDSGARVLTLRAHDDLKEAAFAPDGRHVLTAGADGALQRWDIAGVMTGGAAATLTQLPDRAGRVRFSPDGIHLAAGDWRGTLAVWRADRPGERPGPAWRSEAHGGRIHMLRFSPDGGRIATAGRDRTARLWRVTDGAPLAVLYGHDDDVRDIVFSPDGGLVATASDDGNVRLFDAEGGRLMAMLDGHSGGVRRLAWTPDGRHLVSASNDGTARLWRRPSGGEDTGTGWESRVLDAHDAAVTTAIVAPDGTQVAIASADGTASLWSVETGEMLRRLPADDGALFHIDFAPDGRRLATGGESGTVRIWDVRTGRELSALSGHTGAIESLAFGTDGKRVVTGSSDGTVRLWDAASGVTLARTVAAGAPVEEAALAADGRAIAAGVIDGRVTWTRVYPDTRSLVTHARGLRERPLGPVERRRYFLDVEADG